ncbi:glycosyltransferase [Thiomicrorhabdus sp. Milos-T2]|uniref:glycosyltransferase n=1 Tax=Thiomicrorhabdus sp. Milos-T2 TaxID=90814 RepID=UPI000494AA97|nr:glycosyltransferase [Thiomicrorhabdus sp. Milos-T2]
MNIILLIDNLGSGGAQRQIVNLANDLICLKFNVTLIYYRDLTHYQKDLSSSVKLVRIGHNKNSNISLLFKVIKRVNTEKPDVLISYLNTPNMIGLMCKLLRPRTNWIASERNTVKEPKLKELLWRKIAFFFADSVVSNSYSQKEWLENNKLVKKSKSHLIWNSVAPQFFQVSSSGAPNKFLSIGRISYQKNPELLVDTIKAGKELLPPDFSMDWYGDDDPEIGDMRERIQQKIRKHAIPITFHSSTTNIIDAYQNSGCLILTSRFEGLPNVVLEAMANGVFVIASNVSDIPLLLGKNERGFIYEEGNSEALLAKIKKYFTLNEQERFTLIAKAKTFALNNFENGSLGKNHLKLIYKGKSK